MSNAILEAMASGVPVIASKVGGIPDIIKNGETGQLINPKKPDQIASVILTLLRRSDLRKTYGQNAKNFVLNFSWENIAKRVIEVYRTSIGEL
jgi:glycosyltransferase involved in cell wall biosynthesis